MTKRWQGDRKKDYYYKLAKSEEYRSRASYKLKQLNKKFRLIKRNDAVLDLGAAPGGWMQAAGEIVGRRGIVVGVDLEEIEPFEGENIIPLTGDMRQPRTIERIKEIREEFDAVISDASPDISGVWDVDHFNSVDLARHALGIATNLLKEGGNLLVKVFQGNLLKEFEGKVRKEFETVKTAKPKASRKQSSEVYITGTGLLKTPVRYGDVLEVEVTGTTATGEGIAYSKGFKIIIKDVKTPGTATVKIKKVSRDCARAVRL